jgi:hypothetical protein
MYVGSSIRRNQGLIVVDINTVKLGAVLPKGFLGTSMEWPGVQYYGRNANAWGRILRILGPGATIRIGGASQDKLEAVSMRAPTSGNWGKAVSAEHSAC